MKAIKLHYALNLVFLFGLIFFSESTFAQKNWNTKEKEYFNGIALSGLLDVDKKEVISMKPYAKNVNLTFDPFYKKYTINFDADGSATRIILAVSGKASNGDDLFIDEYAPKNKQVEFFVINSIETDGKLVIMTAYPIESKGVRYKLINIFEDFD